MKLGESPEYFKICIFIKLPDYQFFTRKVKNLKRQNFTNIKVFFETENKSTAYNVH